MDPTIDLLRRYGHHNNPAIRRHFEGMPDHVWDRIKPTEMLGQMLIASYQQMMAPEHETLVRKLHHREAWFDGELGPATRALFERDRCGHPDYEPLEMEATGSGSWRAGCLAEYPDIHAVYYHLDERRMTSQHHDWWAEITEMVIDAYAELGLLWVRTENKQQAQIHVSFEVLPGPTIGLAQLPPLSEAQACTTGWFCKLDPGYAPNAVQVAKLWGHEFGHNLKSGHISGDPIMHPGILNGWNRSFRGTRFGDRLATWFGGERVGDDKKPPPEETDNSVWSGVVTNLASAKTSMVTISMRETQ